MPVVRKGVPLTRPNACSRPDQFNRWAHDGTRSRSVTARLVDSPTLGLSDGAVTLSFMSSGVTPTGTAAAAKLPVKRKERL